MHERLGPRVAPRSRCCRCCCRCCPEAAAPHSCVRLLRPAWGPPGHRQHHHAHPHPHTGPHHPQGLHLSLLTGKEPPAFARIAITFMIHCHHRHSQEFSNYVASYLADAVTLNVLQLLQGIGYRPWNILGFSASLKGTSLQTATGRPKGGI